MNPLEDHEAEEAILSAMLWGTRVESLTGDEFTCPDRKALYLAIRSGTDYRELYKLVEEPAYVTDLFFAPTLAPRFLKEAVADLKRLRELRELHARVYAWMAAMPHLDLKVAKRRLAQLLA